MNKLPERIRIKDIARLADVSVGTVDRVLHGRTGVSETSRKRVEEILKQLDYQPNMYASALASNKKYQFVCLFPQHKEGEYWTDVEAGINVQWKPFPISISRSLSPIMINTSMPLFTNSGKEILAREVDGVLVAPTIPEITSQFIEQLQKERNPLHLHRFQCTQPPAISLLRTEIRTKRVFCRTHGNDAGRKAERNCRVPPD